MSKQSKRKAKADATPDPLSGTYYDVPFTCTGLTDTEVVCCIPRGGMGANRIVSIPKSAFPAELLAKIENGLTFQVEASIGVLYAKDMKFKNFRIPAQTATEQFAEHRTMFPWMEKHSKT